MSRRRTVTVHTCVDIDMDELDTDDLIAELESRNVSGVSDDLSGDILEMYYAFKLGASDRAMDLARKISQAATGRIL